MGTDNERCAPTFGLDEDGILTIDGDLVDLRNSAHLTALVKAAGVAREPVGMTVTEMIEWLTDAADLACWPNAGVRRPQYRRKAEAEVVADKVPLTRLIGRTLIGADEPVDSINCCPADGWEWFAYGGRYDSWQALPIDDDGLVAVKPIEAS